MTDTHCARLAATLPGATYRRLEAPGRRILLDSRRLVSRWASLTSLAWVLLAGAASAQVTPAAAVTPPDDTPSVRVGVVFFGDYTYTKSPQTTDSDGNQINPSAFNVTRTYINVTGNIS